MTAPHELDGLVEEMLPTAAEIAINVRDRDTAGVHAALAPVLDGDRNRIAALIIALGALVPDDQPYADLLAWTFQDQLPYGQLALDAVEKWCGSCQQVRSRRTEFHVDRSRKDGLFARCKVCVSEERQEQRRRRADREQREVA